VLDLFMGQYLALNLWALSETTEGARIMGFVTAHDVGSRVGRRLLVRGALMLLLLGAVRVALQRQEWMAIGQRSALSACALFTYLMVAAYQHASMLRSEIQARRAIENDLGQAIADRNAALKQVRRERNLLNGVLAGASPYAVVATDPDGIISHFNKGAEQMLGYRAEELVGKCAPNVLHDPDEIAQRAKLFGTSSTFDVFRVLPNLDLPDHREWTFVRKCGSKLPVNLSVTRLADDAGVTEGYVGIARDLTQDKQNQRDRDGFFAVGQELLCVIDVEGRLHMANPAFTRMLGYARDELVGGSVYDFVHPDDIEATQAIGENLMDGAKIYRFENRWRAKDGRYHWISWDCSSPTEEGLFYASGWDVSAEKRQARQRERHLEFEQQLIGIVSHDLRNPIAAIALTAEALMRKKDLAPTLERPLQRITHSAKRAERMIFDLLDFTQARLGSGLIMHRSQVDMLEVARRCLDDLQTIHPTRQLNLVSHGDPVVDADGDRMAQVITNLAGNGLKYSPHDAPVTLTLTHAPDAFTLEVHNEGDPIPPSELPHIFKLLRRGSHLGQAERNIGLGLYIVKEIVKAHGGTIGVTSDLLHGTTFKVSLPQAPQPARALARPITAHA